MLRSIREEEKEIDWWNCTLPPLRQVQKPTMAQETKDPLLSGHQAEGRDPGHGGEQKRVNAPGSRRIHPQPALPSQVPVHKRYEALEMDGQTIGDADKSPSGMEGLSRQPTPCIKTTLVKTKSG